MVSTLMKPLAPSVTRIEFFLTGCHASPSDRRPSATSRMTCANSALSLIRFTWHSFRSGKALTISHFFFGVVPLAVELG